MPTMLNRRKAILAATGSILLTGRNAADAIANDTLADSSAFVPNENSNPSVGSELAAACLECASACSDGFEHSNVPKDLVVECKEICTVTATLVAYLGEASPAICQSCADACGRLAAACRSHVTSPWRDACRVAAKNCAKVCHLHVSRVS